MQTDTLAHYRDFTDRLRYLNRPIVVRHTVNVHCQHKFHLLLITCKTIILLDRITIIDLNIQPDHTNII
jgi:hypothetical protein